MSVSLKNGSVRIFLAEDNIADVYLIREALDQAGLKYSLDVAENGERASNLLHEFTPDFQPNLIVLDLNLPRVTGSELLALIKASQVLKDIPVVIFTSSDSPHDRAEISRLGASRYLRKPSNLDEFLAMGEELARMVR